MATVTDPDKTTSYTYDDNGNIKTITSAGNLITYIYNEISELIREDNQVLGKTITYRYDGGGNLLEKKEYAYTTGTPGASTRTLPYGYADTNWKDKLTSFDGKTITYDTIGNPLSFDGWTYTWEEGRQLKSMTKGSTALSFKYNSSGLRTEKSVNGVPTKYIYLGGKVAFETTGAETSHYTYDGSGAPFSMTYNGSEYFYLTNLQGDVTGLADAAGATVVSYTYDSWGKLTSTTGSMATSLGVKNPYRYRGYRYDTETGLYYLQSRYYNPEIGRFINADDASILYLSNNEILHYNIFIYVNNNPINHIDPTGHLAEILIGAAFSGALAWLLFKIEVYLGMRSNNNWALAGIVTVNAAMGAATGGLFGSPTINLFNKVIKFGGLAQRAGLQGTALKALQYLNGGIKFFVNTIIKPMTRYPGESWIRVLNRGLSSLW